MPTKPKIETVTMVVDGREIEAHKGEMVIAAAERAGVYIPRFCWHPRMKEIGVCRMCVVDVKGPRGWGLSPACYIPAAQGVEINTQSERVKKAQDGILEFLLINHPLDCPVCDKGGECPLQDQTVAFGPGESRFIEEKGHFEKPIPVSDLVNLDRERCIVCQRCTNFADKVAGDAFLTLQARGNTTQVNTFPDEPFASYFSGNTVQICPVGALTAEPYRFKARPWDLEQVESTCTSCSVGCRIAVQSSQNELTRYLGLDAEPTNHGWLCDKGRFDFEAINSANRVTVPMARKGGELVEVTWGEALTIAADGLAEARRLHGPEGLAMLGGARLADEDAYAWAKLAKGILGTDNVDAQMGDGLPAELVLSLPRATIDEACWADTLVLVAPDLKEELPVLFLRLKEAALDHGVKVIEITPKLTGFTQYATVTLPHRAGEAPAIVAALLADADPFESVAGVPKEMVAAARTLLAGERSVVVVAGRPNLAESVDFTVQAICALRDGLPHATFLPALRRANVFGALDAGLSPGLLPGRVTLAEGAAKVGAAWGSVPASKGLDALGIAAAAATGQIHGLLLVGADPIGDMPDKEMARRALSGAGFVVAVDTFRTASLEHADVVLPAAAFAERAGTTTNLEGRVTRLGRKVVPPGVAWADWMIAAELAIALGADLGVETLAELAAELEQVSVVRSGLTAAVLSERANRDGVVVPLPAVSLSEVLVDRADAEAAPEPDAAGVDADDAAPATKVADAADGVEGTDSTGEAHVVDAAPAALPPFASPVATSVKADGYSLRLVSSRTLYDNGTLVANSPHLAPLAKTIALRINPTDVTRFGLSDGQAVRVTSARTTVTLPVQGDQSVPKGSAWLPWNAPGANGCAAAELLDNAAPVCDLRVENA